MIDALLLLQLTHALLHAAAVQRYSLWLLRIGLGLSVGSPSALGWPSMYSDSAAQRTAHSTAQRTAQQR